MIEKQNENDHGMNIVARRIKLLPEKHNLIFLSQASNLLHSNYNLGENLAVLSTIPRTLQRNFI